MQRLLLPARSIRVLLLQFLTVALVAVISLWHLPAAAAAAPPSLLVTSTSDDGTAGTLRDAINQANLTPGSTITISVTGTITLLSSLPAITADTTIKGPGQYSLTVSGANLYRVFQVNSGTVSITDLGTSNGKAIGYAGANSGSGGGGGGGGAGAGGGLLVKGGNVFLNRIRFSNNVAIGGAGGSAGANRGGPGGDGGGDPTGVGGGAGGVGRNGAGGSNNFGDNGGAGGALAGGGGGGWYFRGNGQGFPPGRAGNGGSGGAFGGGGGGGGANWYSYSPGSLGGGGSLAGRGGDGYWGDNGPGGGGGGGAGVGGAIFVSSGSLTITNTSFSGDSVAGGSGGTAGTINNCCSQPPTAATPGSAGGGAGTSIYNYQGTVYAAGNSYDGWSPTAGTISALPTPAITSLSRTTGIQGTSVTITGTHFWAATAVSFGGTAASSFTVDSDTQITAVVGAGSKGLVSVTTPPGSGTYNGFAWLPTTPNIDVGTVNGGSNPVAGANFAVVVNAYDAGGNPLLVSANTSVQLSLSSGTGTLGGTLVGTITAGTSSVTISGVTYTKAQSGVVLSAAVTGGDVLQSGTSMAFSVDPGPISAFLVAPSGTVTAGSPFNITVTAMDAYSNVATGYAGPHSIALSSTATASPNSMPPTIPASATASFSGGIASIGGFTLTNAGQLPTISATDAPYTGTSSAITVQAAAASAFSFAGNIIANQTAGVIFSTTFTALDPYGNTATTYQPAHNLHFTTTGNMAPDGTSTPTLPPDGKPSFTNGVATVSGFILYKVESGRWFSATENRTSITGYSNAFDVAPGSTATFAVAPSGAVTAGAAFSVDITARDTWHNVTPGYATTLHYSTTAGAAPDGVTTPLVSPDGTVTFDANAKSTVSGFKLYKAESAAITVTDTVTNKTGTSAAFAVAPGATVQFVVAPSGAVSAGQAFGLNVTAKDTWQNLTPGYSSNFHYSTTAVTAPDGTTTPFVPGDGVLTFDGSANATISGFKLYKAESPTITVNDIVSGKSKTSNAFSVSPGAGASFSFTGSSIAGQTAGSPFAIAFTALDTWANVATGYQPAHNLHVTTTGGTAPDGVQAPALPPDSTPSFTNGVATMSGATLYKAESGRTITVAETSTGITGSSNTFNVAPGSTATFAVAPSGAVTAGQAFGINVTAMDTWQNLTPGYATTLHYSTTAGTAPDGVTTPLVSPDGTVTFDANAKSTVSGFKLYKAESPAMTVTDTVTNKTGTSAAFAVAPGATVQFAVAPSGAVTAGQAFGINVTAMDTWRNLTPGYSSTFHYSTTAGTAPDGATTPFVPADGLLTFDGSANATISGFNLYKAESPTITVSDTVSGKSKTSNAFTVSPGAGASFSFTGSSIAGQTAGSPFAIAFTALDTWANVATGYQPAHNLHVTTTGGTAPDGMEAPALPPDSMPSFTNGVATMSGTTLYKAESGRTITVAETSTGITGSSNAFNVAPGSTATFAVAPSGAVTAGQAFGINVTAMDTWQNLTPGYATTLHYSTTAGTAPDGVTTPLIPGDAAVTFDGSASATVGGFTLFKAESPTTTVTDTVSGKSQTSNAFMVSPGAGASFSFTGSSIAGQTAGSPFAIAFTALDNWANVATGYQPAHNLHVTTTGGTAPDGVKAPALPPDSMPSFTNGVATMSGTTLYKAENGRTITVGETSTGITGSSNAFNVAPGSTVALAVAPSGAVTAGAAFSVEITAMDTWQNLTPGYSSNFHYSTTAGTAPDGVTTPIVSPDGTVTFDANAKSTVSGFKLYKAESPTITVTDTVTNKTGTSAAFAVAPGATVQFAVAPSGAVTAGQAFGINVTAMDTWQNLTPGYATTLHYSTTAGTAPDGVTTPLIPGDAAVTFDGSASATVSGFTLYKAESPAITVTDTATNKTGTSAAFAVAPGATVQFAVAPSGAVTAGQVFGLNVTAMDTWQNLTPGYSSNFHYSTTAGTAPDGHTTTLIPGDAAVTFDGSASATVSAFTLYKAESLTITVTDITTGKSRTTNAFTVAPATLASLTASAGATQVAGVAFPIDLRQLDAFGNVQSSYAATDNISVVLGASDVNATLPTSVQFMAGIGSVNVILTVAQANTLTITDSSISKQAAAGSLSVSPGPTAVFIMATGVGNQYVGNTVGVTARTQDAFGNRTPTYTGTVEVTSSDSAAAKPAGTHTFAPGDLGLWGFDITFKTPGSHTVTVTDVTTSAIKGTSPSVSITYAPPTPVTIITVSGPTEVGVGQTATYSASATDSSGHVGAVSFSWSVSGGSISTGTWSAPTVAGVYTVSATSSGVTSNLTVRVLHGAATAVALSPVGSAAITAGQPLNFTYTATDRFGNVVTDIAPVWSGSGVGTVADGSFTSTAAGTARVSVAVGGVSATSGPITIAPGPVSRVTVSGPAALETGTAAQYGATAADQYGNAIPNATFRWTAAVGMVDATGRFTPGTTTGPGSVTATTGGVSDSLALTITATPSPVSAGGAGISPNSQTTPANVLALTAPVVVTGTGMVTVHFAVTPNQGPSVFASYYDASLKAWIAVPTTASTSGYTASLPAGAPVVLLSGYISAFHDAADNWAQPYILKLQSLGLVNGDDRGNFNPDANVSRYELAKVVAMAAGLNVTSPDLSVLSMLTDGQPIPGWAKPYVAAVLKAGLMKGAGGSFKGGGTVTRAEMATILGRLLSNKGNDSPSFTDEHSIPDWALAGVQKAVAAGILGGFPDHTFRAGEPLTRGQMAKVIALLLDSLANGH